MNGVRAAVVGLALLAPSSSTVPSPVVEPTGGVQFWCALFQTVKIASLITGQLEGVVVGAVAGGIACGMGW